jgi:hypothetical protein
VEAPAELAVADPERFGELIDAAAGEAEAPGGREDERVGPVGGDARSDRPLEQCEGLSVVLGLTQSLTQLSRRGSEQFLQPGVDVENLARGHSQNRSGDAGSQPQPEDPLAGRDPARPSGSVDPGEDELALAPEQVDAAVREDQDRLAPLVVGGLADPPARHQRVHVAGRSQLAVRRHGTNLENVRNVQGTSAKAA